MDFGPQSCSVQKGFPLITDQGWCGISAKPPGSQKNTGQCGCCQAMLDGVPKDAPSYKSGANEGTVIRESVTDTGAVQQEGSRQKLVEELTSPRTFHLEYMCEEEMKNIIKGCGAALEDSLERCGDVATDNSRLSSVRSFPKLLELSIT